MQEVVSKVENKEQLIELLTTNIDTIKSYGVSQLGVFGSFVRNEMNEDSDVDFLVDFHEGKKTLRSLVVLGDFLEEILGRKVELVTVGGLSKYIGPKILAATEYVFLQH